MVTESGTFVYSFLDSARTLNLQPHERGVRSLPLRYSALVHTTTQLQDTMKRVL